MHGAGAWWIKVGLGSILKFDVGLSLSFIKYLIIPAIWSYQVIPGHLCCSFHANANSLPHLSLYFYFLYLRPKQIKTSLDGENNLAINSSRMSLNPGTYFHRFYTFIYMVKKIYIIIEVTEWHLIPERLKSQKIWYIFLVCVSAVTGDAAHLSPSVNRGKFEQALLPVPWLSLFLCSLGYSCITPSQE